MVEEVGDAGVDADVAQIPEVTAQLLVAQGTHEVLALALAHLVSRSVVVDGEHAVQKHQQTHDGSRQEPTRVQACMVVDGVVETFKGMGRGKLKWVLECMLLCTVYLFLRHSD